MTNEEIRLNRYCKHCRNYDKDCSWLCRRMICNEADAYEMALDEKDQQFKSYLEKKRDSFNKDAEKWFNTKNMEHVGVISKHGWSIINEIINELFGE